MTLLEDVPGAEVKRPKNLLHSSKNTGEAPLFLGASAFFALKQVQGLSCFLHQWTLWL